jgi:5-methylthioadenosine/S-adenosylhomocysteine deaminase
MPGLINLHGHSAMTLLRGLADDKALMDWLNNHIWPAEGKHVRDDFVFDGASLAMAEMIRGGTTTINDMYFYHAAMARAGLASGMRTLSAAPSWSSHQLRQQRR